LERGIPFSLSADQIIIPATKREPKKDFRGLIDQYRGSSAFLGLAADTRRTCGWCIEKIEEEFGDLAISALEERGMSEAFLAWRDRIAASSTSSADAMMRVLRRIISWAVDRRLVTTNPCKKIKKLHKGSRAQQVWSPEQEAAFYAAAPKHLHLALLLAKWTGQRQKDLLELKWANYDGELLYFQQSKTDARVPIPVAQDLREALDSLKDDLLKSIKETELRERTILTNTRGDPWTSAGFRCSWVNACKSAGVADVTFHDLRGTLVTRAALAGCSVPQIAALTGHSLRDAEIMLGKHYLARDPRLALDAIVSSSKRQKLPTEFPTADFGPAAARKILPKNNGGRTRART
jgi:integrase